MSDKVYSKSYEMPVLLKKVRDDGITISILSGKNEKKWYDIRRYITGSDGVSRPTKTGIRFGDDLMCELISMYEEVEDPVTKLLLNEVTEEEKKNKKEKVKEMFKKKEVEKKVVKKEEDDDSSSVSDIQLLGKKTKKNN